MVSICFVFGYFKSGSIEVKFKTRLQNEQIIIIKTIIKTTIGNDTESLPNKTNNILSALLHCRAFPERTKTLTLKYIFDGGNAACAYPHDGQTFPSRRVTRAAGRGDSTSSIILYTPICGYAQAASTTSNIYQYLHGSCLCAIRVERPQTHVL